MEIMLVSSSSVRLPYVARLERSWEVSLGSETLK